MFQVFRNAWMDTQLRKKILYTLFIIILFRLGSNIFVPFLNNDAIQTMTSGASLLNYLDVMTGGSLGKGTLLAMSITPYINASIIIQLLAVAIPPLEKLQKEGEQGRKKLNTITKITSLAIAVLQAISFYIMLRNGTTVRRCQPGKPRHVLRRSFSYRYRCLLRCRCVNDHLAGRPDQRKGYRQRYLHDTVRRYHLRTPECCSVLRDDRQR